MKMIIDTDPGIDDAMAYFYAFGAPEIELIGLTTIFGNVTIQDATRNALWMAEFTGSNIEVCEGERQPLHILPNPPSDYVHGPHGFGDYVIGTVKGIARPERAADFLVRKAREAPGEITLCAVGPLTNVALAIKKDPDFISNLTQLVIMGGALDVSGNVGPYAEANFWNDPHAADSVVNAPGAGKIVIVGLDVTSKIEFGASDFEGLALASPRAGVFLREIARFYLDFYQSKTGRLSCHMHDPTAIIASLKPELFRMQEVALRVVTDGEEIGNLVRREQELDEGRKCLVCLQVEAEDVIKDYKQTVALNP